jgi:murein DD-endopeptidase MepM/ murein hydrolase activator NlpD
VKLLQVSLVEEISGEPCSIPPEYVFTAAEAAELLLAGEPSPERVLLSRGVPSETFSATAASTAEAESEEAAELLLPRIHVVTEEEVTVQERIAFSTTYTYSSSLWSVQSRVSTPGQDGSKTVVYHVTSKNGVETARHKVSEQVLEPPVTQVIERGTARVPAMGTGQFLWPVQGGGSLSQGYRGWNHAGIDISYGGLGTRHPRILAADSGVVVETGTQYPQGNHIIIYHGRYYTVYLHNSANFVSKGQTVSRGQHIANMGNTGRTFGRDGIHLHFEVRVCDGSGVWRHWRQHPPVDPLSFFSAR